MTGGWTLISQERVTSRPMIYRERMKQQTLRSRRENKELGVDIRSVTKHFLYMSGACRRLIRQLTPAASRTGRWWPMAVYVGKPRRRCGNPRVPDLQRMPSVVTCVLSYMRTIHPTNMSTPRFVSLWKLHRPWPDFKLKLTSTNAL